MAALRVVHAFADYEIGALITDADAMKGVLASSCAQHVVRVQDEPKPEPAPKPSKPSDPDRG